MFDSYLGQGIPFIQFQLHRHLHSFSKLLQDIHLSFPFLASHVIPFNCSHVVQVAQATLVISANVIPNK